MSQYQLVTTVQAVQYDAPKGDEGGNVAEVQALAPDATEQADWAPAQGKNALVLEPQGASIADTDWVVLYEDSSLYVVDDSEFHFEPVAEPLASGLEAVEAAATNAADATDVHEKAIAPVEVPKPTE